MKSSSYVYTKKAIEKNKVNLLFVNKNKSLNAPSKMLKATVNEPPRGKTNNVVSEQV